MFLKDSTKVNTSLGHTVSSRELWENAKRDDEDSRSICMVTERIKTAIQRFSI